MEERGPSIGPVGEPRLCTCPRYTNVKHTKRNLSFQDDLRPKVRVNDMTADTTDLRATPTHPEHRHRTTPPFDQNRRPFPPYHAGQDQLPVFVRI